MTVTEAYLSRSAEARKIPAAGGGPDAAFDLDCRVAPPQPRHSRLNQFTTVEITPGLVDSQKQELDLMGGAAFIFSRERNAETDVRMPAANAALRGTQLFAQVLPGGKSLIHVLEGSVEMDSGVKRSEHHQRQGHPVEKKPAELSQVSLHPAS